MSSKDIARRLQLSTLTVAGALTGLCGIGFVSGCQSYPSETPRPRPPRPGASDQGSAAAQAPDPTTASPETLPTRAVYPPDAESDQAEPAEAEPAEAAPAEAAPAEAAPAKSDSEFKDEVPEAIPLP